MTSTSNPGSTPPGPAREDLQGYEVLIAVCGGIAAYKVASLVSALVQRHAGVTVAMTESAQKFITPLTFQSLTTRRVFTGMWDANDFHDPQHLKLSEAADLLVVAPATANIIGKTASGIADDLVSTMIMATACPVLFVPAMNTRMWDNPIVQQNVRTLEGHGYRMIEPSEGWLACGTLGRGRMAEPADILAEITKLLQKAPPKHAQD